MAFKSWSDHNPFLVFAGVFALLVWAKGFMARSRRGGRSAPKVAALFNAVPGWMVKAWIVLAWVCVGWFVVFEMYYYVYNCAVSARYHDETVLIAQRVIGILEDNDVPYWMDYASLLAVIRGQSINEWDHDTDISIMFPERGKDFLMDAIRAAGMYPVWDAREAIQIMPHEGANPLTHPHMDIWFWRKGKTADGSKVLSTADVEVVYRFRAWDDVFPLKKAKWKAWPGHPVYVPAHDHAVSEKEFGGWPGSYLTPVVYKGDCFHNWFQRRWLY